MKNWEKSRILQRASSKKSDVEDLEDEIYDTDYDSDDEDYEETPAGKKSDRKKKKKGPNSAVTIVALACRRSCPGGGNFCDRQGCRHHRK